MNHPTHEEWMSYLYGESNGEQHTTLTAHLAVCPECKASVETWRSAGQQLDAWQLPATVLRRGRRWPVLRWAAAAAIILGLGFGFGRFSAPASANPDQIRAAIEPSIREQLRKEFAILLQDELERSAKTTLGASGAQTRELLNDFARVNNQNRADDNRLVSAALEKLDSQRVADYTSLKRDLDTVAVYSEAGILQTRQQLVQLAGYTGPAGNSPELPRN